MDSSLDPPAAPSASVPDAIRLAEHDAQAVLLVRSVEEADPKGELLPQAERQRAAEAADRTAGFARFVAQRAQALAAGLEAERGFLRRLRRLLLLRPAALWLLGPAFAIGLATNLLGPHKRINVVANPLAALLVWNLAVYALLALGAVLARRRTRPAAGPLAALAGAWASWRARRQAQPTELGLPTFIERWSRVAAPLLAARSRRVLHGAALALVLGALLGMYARGLLFEYRATWESTFLSSETVATWLGALLWPAARLSGLALPALEGIEAPDSGAAAVWIHLYAITTGLGVVAPRLVLTWLAGGRAQRLSAGLSVDTDAPYYRRLWSQALGRESTAQVWPYSYTLGAARADRLKALLHDVLGARASIRIAQALSYGAGLEDLRGGALDGAGSAAENEAARRTASAEVSHVMLFNLAQTPETEVHASLARDLVQAAEEGSACLVLVDEAAWLERSDAATRDRRRGERRRTWERVLRDAGVRPVFVDLDGAPPSTLLDDIEGAWQPQPGARP